MKVAFISGHLSLTALEFTEHYEKQIKDAILRGDHFVVGDAPGADWLAQGLLYSFIPHGQYHRVTVYHMLEEPRNAVTQFARRGGFKSDTSRDAAMTLSSHYDIAWVRPGKEESGTARNIQRRNKNGTR